MTIKVISVIQKPYGYAGTIQVKVDQEIRELHFRQSFRDDMTCTTHLVVLLNLQGAI